MLFESDSVYLIDGLTFATKSIKHSSTCSEHEVAPTMSLLYRLHGIGAECAHNDTDLIII